MDILITGASGRLGSYFMPIFLEKYKNDNITLFSRQHTNFNKAHENIKEISGDLKSLMTYKNELKSFDMIIWLASKINYEDDYSTMYRENTKPVEIAQQLWPSAKIVYVSSISVYGERDYGQRIITEETSLNPNSFYGKSKLEAEIIAMKFQNYQILRPSVLIGKGYTTGFERVYKKLLNKSYFFIGNVNSFLPFVHAYDTANAIVFCAARLMKNKNDIFNVSLPPVTQKTLVDYVCKLAGFTPPNPNLVIPPWLLKLSNFYVAKEFNHLIDQVSCSRYVSSEKIIKEGFVFEKSWQQGIEEITIDLMKAYSQKL